MKKIFKFRTILIAIIAVFSFMLLFSVNNIKVSADDGFGLCDNSDGAYLSDEGACKTEERSGNDSVTVTKGGMINVAYKNGITEVLIYAEACSSWEYDNDEKVICNDNGRNGTWTGKKLVIHGSGDYKQGSKTIHLYKYFEKDTLVRVSMIYEFMSAENRNLKEGLKNDSSSGAYNPRYCELSIARYECAKYYTVKDNNWEYNDEDWGNKSQYSIKSRVDIIKVNNQKISYKSIEKLDKNGIVYVGDNVYEGDNGVQDTFPEEGGVNGVYVIVSNTIADNAGDGFLDIVYETVIPVLLIMLGLAATITIVVFGVQIIRGADDPQERSDKIKRLAGILIGIAIVFVLLAAIEPIYELIQNMWEE